VQLFPSLQAVPSATIGLEQEPVDGSHVPTMWQGRGAGQVTELVDPQTPAWQESASVQALPSLHVVPSAA
jgi:hypothetical protein